MAHILVGIDGSTESVKALGWAIDEARLRGAELRVLCAYERPREPYPYAAEYVYVPRTVARRLFEEERKRRAEQHDRARHRAESLVATAIRDAAPEGPGVRLKTVVVEDDRPARALIRSARDADLLVVGSRGLGGVKGRLLGSVSQQCARHAPCPVVVVGRDVPAHTSPTVAA